MSVVSEVSVFSVGIDNDAAQSLINDPLSMSRTKHIDIIYHHVRERVRKGWLSFRRVASADNVADILTKALPLVVFQAHRARLGVVRSSGVRGCVEKH
jgi:hypothetical protein